MLIKVSDVRDAIEEVWITLLWTKINKIDTYSEDFFWKWEHVQFRGFQSKKNKNEEIKSDVMALHPRHIVNWVSLFVFKLKDLELKLMSLSTLWMVLKNMGLVKKLGPTLYFNDRYWEVIKVWGKVLLLHFCANYCCCPRQIQYCKRKERKKKIELWRSHWYLFKSERKKSQWPRLIC
jgi:hypothetical protein